MHGSEGHTLEERIFVEVSGEQTHTITTSILDAPYKLLTELSGVKFKTASLRRIYEPLIRGAKGFVTSYANVRDFSQIQQELASVRKTIDETAKLAIAGLTSIIGIPTGILIATETTMQAPEAIIAAMGTAAVITYSAMTAILNKKKPRINEQELQIRYAIGLANHYREMKGNALALLQELVERPAERYTEEEQNVITYVKHVAATSFDELTFLLGHGKDTNGKRLREVAVYLNEYAIERQHDITRSREELLQVARTQTKIQDRGKTRESQLHAFSQLAIDHQIRRSTSDFDTFHKEYELYGQLKQRAKRYARIYKQVVNYDAITIQNIRPLKLKPSISEILKGHSKPQYISLKRRRRIAAYLQRRSDQKQALVRELEAAGNALLETSRALHESDTPGKGQEFWGLGRGLKRASKIRNIAVELPYQVYSTTSTNARMIDYATQLYLTK